MVVLFFETQTSGSFFNIKMCVYVASCFNTIVKPEKLRVSITTRACELRVPTQQRDSELCVSTLERGPGLARTRFSAITDSHELGWLHPIFSPHNGK